MNNENAPLSLQDQFWDAVKGGTPDVISQLLAKGARPNVLDAKGRSSLSLAIRLKRPLAVVKVLLEAGGDPTLVEPCGDTVLHLAIKKQAPFEGIELLVAFCGVEGVLVFHVVAREYPSLV